MLRKALSRILRASVFGTKPRPVAKKPQNRRRLLLEALEDRTVPSFNGAIYTSLADGSAVNTNLFASKDLVFLNGGPHNTNSSGLNFNGSDTFTAVFMVTDPSGSRLLSTDVYTDREVQIVGGTVMGGPGSDTTKLPSNTSQYTIVPPYHRNGYFNAANNSMSIQLGVAPNWFDTTPNMGGEYKVWLTPLSEFDAAHQDARHNFGFDGERKTDSFKVGIPHQTFDTQIDTIASPGTVTLDGSGNAVVLTDTANLQNPGGGTETPDGTIQFNLIAPDSSVVDTETVTVNHFGSYATPTGYTLPATGSVTGTYLWLASYSGSTDGYYTGSIDDGTNESIVVSPANPTLVTTASPNGTFTLGTGTQSLSDSADLEGAYYPGGSVTFVLKYNGNQVYSDTESVSGNGSVSSGSYTLPTNTTVTGNYVWTATYHDPSGNNNDAVDDGTSALEQLTVNPANPTLVTTASPNGTITLGDITPPVLSDSADLEGAYFPSGSITFVLKYNGNQVYTDTESVSGNGSVSTGSYTLPTNATVTGNYVWTATYHDPNSNNSDAIDDGTSALEQLTVNPTNPAIVTTASPASTTLGAGANLNDSATLSGGYYATGTITFTLYNPSNTAVYTDVVTLTGAASTVIVDTSMGNNPGGWAPVVAGVYHWVTAYSGDGNNNGVTDPGTVAAEQETVFLTISGYKFEDHNGNGVKDTGDGLLGGWTIQLYQESNNIAGLQTGTGGDTLVGTQVTAAVTGAYSFGGLLPGTYYTREVLQTSWVQTTGNMTLTNINTNQTDNFGNSHLGTNSGAFTLGFWSNNNGQAILAAHDPAWRTLLNSLHLRNANGTAYTVPTTGTFANAYSNFRTWLLGANATNMATMLSAQLATMELNVGFKGISPSQYLFVGTGSAINTWGNNSQGSNLKANLTSGATTYGLVAPNALGFIKIQDLMNNAIYMLTNYGSTVASGSARLYEEALKILLDGANNNLSIFVL